MPCHIVIYTFIIRSMKILRSNLPTQKNVWLTVVRSFPSISRFMHKKTFSFIDWALRNARSNCGNMLPRAARNCQRKQWLKAWKKPFCVNFLFIQLFFFIRGLFSCFSEIMNKFSSLFLLLLFRISIFSPRWAFLKKRGKYRKRKKKSMKSERENFLYY